MKWRILLNMLTVATIIGIVFDKLMFQVYELLLKLHLAETLIKSNVV